MSRCIPFPPPGYELKPRPDDVNLIIKEKKQKKHKDKKNKDKKERKEKERSEGKTKEDKKRKQKKDKDKKDKKKDKVTPLEEKKTVGSLENQDGEKLVPDNKPTDRIEDKRTFSELGKGVRNDDGASDNKMVRKITFVGKSKANVPGKVQQNSNGMLVGAYDDVKDKRERGRTANGERLRVDARSLGNGFVGNGSCQVDKIEKRMEEKERNGCRKNYGEGYGNENEERNKSTKAEDKRKEEEKKKEKVTVGGKEEFKQGASDENGMRPNNISRPALQCRQAGQNGSGFHPPQNIINLAVEKRAVGANRKDNGKLPSPQSVIKNARHMEPGQTANRSLAEFNNGLISSHHVHIKRKMEPCQTSSSQKNPLLKNGGKMAMQELNADHKTDNKRMNDTLAGKDDISSKPSSAKIKAKEKVDASMKPPHPDLKYLGQILSVPQVEWAQYDDDQEWLFGCKDSRTKRPKLASPQNQVWAEAMQLEPADVTALPYVIPY